MDHNFFDPAEKELNIYLMLDVYWHSELKEKTRKSVKANGTYFAADIAYRLCIPEVVKLIRVFEIVGEAKTQRAINFNIVEKKHRIIKYPTRPLPEQLFHKLRWDEDTRDYHYLLFENLDLTAFGNRIPELAAQVKVKVKLW